MKKITIASSSFIALVALSCTMISCKKDSETAPALPQLSFAKDSYTVKESDGTAQIELVLDKASKENLTVTLAVAGTADADTQDTPGDYSIEKKTIDIPAGQTSGKLDITVYSDYDWEDTEVIAFAIESVNSQQVTITREDQTVVSIEQEDGTVLLLTWDAPNPETGKFADMDLLIRVGADENSLDNNFATGSFVNNFQTPEYIFIPYAHPDATFGASYIYKSGNSDALSFKATFIDFVNGELEDQSGTTSYQGSYTSANKRALTTQADLLTTQVVQTFSIEGGEFINFSEISTPETGSRISSKPASRKLSLNTNADQHERMALKLKAFR